MDPNILISDAPTTISVGGSVLPVNWGWRTGIRAMKAIDDPKLDDKGKSAAVLILYFGRYEDDGSVSLPHEAYSAEATEAALSFFNMNEPQPKRRSEGGRSKLAQQVRVWDWDWDAPRVIADFQREYRIDLTDASLQMHWWRFWSLFRGLGDDSKTMQAIEIRDAKPSGDMTAAERQRLKDRQRALLIPARTEEEAKRISRMMWGIDV